MEIAADQHGAVGRDILEAVLGSPSPPDTMR